jgi:hypothetical protein
MGQGWPDKEKGSHQIAGPCSTPGDRRSSFPVEGAARKAATPSRLTRGAAARCHEQSRSKRPGQGPRRADPPPASTCGARGRPAGG